MAKGGAVKKLEPEPKIESNDKNISVGKGNVASESKKTNITGITTEGDVNATKNPDGTIGLSLKLGRTPPKVPTTTPQRSRRPENKTPPKLPHRDRGVQNSGTPANDDTEFDKDMENGVPKTEEAQGEDQKTHTSPFAGTEKTPDTMGKGDLPSDIVNPDGVGENKKPKTPATNTSAEQPEIANQLQQERQAATTTPNTAETTTKDEEKGSENLPPLFTDVASKLPFFGTLIRLYRSASPKGKLQVLNRMQQMVSFAKLGAAITDGAEQWAALFVPLIPLTFGLILFIAIPAGVIQLLFYATLQETAPSPMAKKLAEVKKILDTMTAAVQEKLQNKEQREQLKARRTAQIASAQSQAAPEPAG